MIDVSVQNNRGFLPGIILFYSVDPMRLTLGNPFNTMIKSFCPYSQYFHLNLSIFFLPWEDALKVYREMPSDFSLNGGVQ